MLGIRQLYPSSVVHATCVLPLDDNPSNKPSSVLLAAIGFSVNAYRIVKCSSSSEPTTISNEEKHSHDVFGFTPTGHSINIGSMVIRIAALRHQIAIFLTRNLELIVVRYQGNLPWNLNEKNNASRIQSLSHQNHWCILYRHTSFALPLTVDESFEVGKPVADPKLIVSESGNTAHAIIFREHVHVIHINHLKTGKTVSIPGLEIFRLLGGNKVSDFYRCAWSGEASIPSREFHFRNHTKSESTYVYGESDDMRAQRLHKEWLLGSPSVADEDLMLDHSIKALSQKKRELEKMTPTLPTRDPRLPTVYISISSSQADCIAPLPSPGLPTDCFIQLITGSSSIDVSCLSVDSNPEMVLPVMRISSCLRVQTHEAELSLSPYYIIAAPPGPRKRMRTRAYAFSSTPNAQYIHLWQISKVGNTDLSVPQKGTRLTTSAERVVAGVFLYQNKLCSLWLLLDDGSLTEIPDQTLEMLRSDIAKDQMMGDASSMHEEGQFNDCLDGAWKRCGISGLPRGFVPRDIQPFNYRSNVNTNPYIAVTQRYVLLTDYICDVFVVDLQERCVVGGLLGEGAVTSVCRGPAHSMVVSHSKGTVTLLSPVVPAMIRTTKVLSGSGEDDNGVVTPMRPLLKTVIQGLFPIWRGCTDSEIREPLWGVMVCDENHTYLFSYSDHDGTGPPMLTEHRKENGTPYWLCDEATLYAAALTRANGDDLILLQCTPTRLLIGHKIINLPGKVTHATGCEVAKVVCGVIRPVMLVAVILTDGLMLFSCSFGNDSDVNSIVATPVYRQTQPWSCPPASVAIDEINEEEVVVLIGMWDGCIDFLRLKARDQEGLWTLTATFHLDPPHRSSSISGFEDCGQLSIPRSIVRMRLGGEAHIQWMILNDNDHLTVIRYDPGLKGEGARRPKWESVTAVMPSCADLRGTGLSCVLRNSGDLNGFDLLLLQDEEIILLVTGAEGDRNDKSNTSVHAVAAMETTPLEFPSNGWQRGFAVQTRSSATGLLQHTLFLTDGHQLVVASLPQLFRQGCCSNSRDTVSLRTTQEQEGDRDKEYLAVVSPITYHLKRRMRVTSNPSQRLIKTLHLSSLGILISILDCGETQSSILVAMSETSLKVCDFLQLPNQVAICATHVSRSPKQLEAFDEASEDTVLIGTAALEGSLDGGQVLIVLACPLRILHTAHVGKDAVIDLSVCRKAGHRGEDSLNHNITENKAKILLAVCCGSVVSVYKLVDYALHPLTSHRFEVDCTSISLCQTFLSVGLGSFGNAFLELVHSQNASTVENNINNTTTDDTLLLEDTLAYAASSTTANGDSENEVLTDEAQSDAAGEMEGGRTNSGEDLAERLNDSATLKLRMLVREHMLGAGVYIQGTYRDRSVRVDDDGGVYISCLYSPSNKNFEHCSQMTGADGDCQVVMSHCWGLPSPASALKVEVPMTIRAVGRSQPYRLHWCERSGVLMPACDDGAAIFFGCLDGSLFIAAEIPYVFAFPLLRMEQVITDYYRDFETISIRNDVVHASYSATNKYQPCSLYSPFSFKLKGADDVIPGPNAHYVYESIPFVASSALRAGARVVVKKGTVWLDVVGEYFLLERIVLGNAVRFGDLVPDVVERNRIEHKYHTLRNALINALHEEYGNELSLMDCEEILNAW